MVNQNENQNEFVLVLGPYNQNGLRFVLQEKVTKTNSFWEVVRVDTRTGEYVSRASRS